MMSTPLIALCSLIYLATAGSLFAQRQIGLGVMFVCYALANVGVILASRGV